MSALKRRGYDSEILKKFCEKINVTRRGNENIIDYKLLENCARSSLKDRSEII